MSEDFDKEAERERLREKYEADQDDREATERMSQLLLQGATMTNKHCDTCGTPIFRYEDQEFCPTCQRRRASAEAEDQSGTGETGEASGEQASQGTDPEKTQAPGTTESTQEGPTQRPGTSAGTPTEAGKPHSPPTEGGRAGDSTGQGQEGPRGPAQPRRQSGDSSAQQPVDAASLDEARASLVRSITSLAQRAERTDDPRQAKELLAGAREAAETLSRLRGN